MFKSIVDFLTLDCGEEERSVRSLFIVFIIVCAAYVLIGASGGRIASADRNATPVEQTTNYRFCPNCGEELK